MQVNKIFLNLMRISLMLLGKTHYSYINEGIKIFSERIKHYIPFEIIIINDSKKNKVNDINQIKKAEGCELLKKILPGDYVILLDEHGTEFSSVEFAAFIESKTLSSIKRLVFIIGGAYGFSNEIYKKANEKLSLSRMTFSHQAARLMFAEQLYRAFTIIKGEQYHH